MGQKLGQGAKTMAYDEGLFSISSKLGFDVDYTNAEVRALVNREALDRGIPLGTAWHVYRWESGIGPKIRSGNVGRRSRRWPGRMSVINGVVGPSGWEGLVE